jgi:2,3-bisphosphoglycerate-dependent phosphoglycerate mutase
MTEIVLIRHGETQWNALGRYQGHTDIALNDTGRAQAQATARAIAHLHKTQPFTGLYASDLQRALQTAQPLAQVLGLPVQTDARLRERHFGALEGLTREQIAQQHPEHAARLLEPHHTPPGGESQAQFFTRVEQVLHGIAAKHRGQTVAAVCHGGTLAMAWRIAHGQWVDAPRAGPMLNASLNSIVHDGTRFTVRYWGEVGHLSNSADDLAA